MHLINTLLLLLNLSPCVQMCFLPDTSDCSCEGNEGRGDQQPVGLTRFLQEDPERGRGARGVPAVPPAPPQGRAVMTPCGKMLPLHPGHINDEWGPKAKTISQAPFRGPAVPVRCAAC